MRTIRDYSDYRQMYTAEAPQLLTIQLKNAMPETILDIGCGDGALLFALNNLGLLDGRKVTAIDIDPERLERLKKISATILPIVGDACNMNMIEESSFDFVISTQVIEHVSDDRMMLNEISRVMKPRAVLFLSTVLKSPNAWYRYRNEGKWVLDPTHKREYTSERQLLTEMVVCGLEIVESSKTIVRRSIAEALLKRIGRVDITGSAFLRMLTKGKIPVVGYYEWEIVATKK